MNITSRYSDIPEVAIDESKVPPAFRPLLALAKEWSIGDDSELDEYIAAASEAKKREVYEAFRPHFSALAEWSNASADITPRPDEVILFDIATQAAATVGASLKQ